MDSIISTFHIDWKIIVAQAINFGIVFIVLYIFALKPLNKLMAEREGKIKKGVDDAKLNSAMLEETKAQYEKIVIKAKAEANAIFEVGKREAETKKTEMMEAAKIEVTDMIGQGKKALLAERLKMVDEAKKEIVGLAMLATRKLIADAADGSFNEKSIKELDNV